MDDGNAGAVCCVDCNGNQFGYRVHHQAQLDDISSVPLSTFTSFFSTANNYEEMKAVDEMNGYGYSRFIEKWHNEGLI